MGLTDIFGEKPEPKVLDFFRLHSYWDYSLKDVSKATDVSHRTLQVLIPKLIKMGFIRYTRTEGKARLYQFNSESPIARHLVEFVRNIDIDEMVKTENKKKVTA